jgi:hypothetical protein
MSVRQSKSIGRAVPCQRDSMGPGKKLWAFCHPYMKLTGHSLLRVLIADELESRMTLIEIRALPPLRADQEPPNLCLGTEKGRGRYSRGMNGLDSGPKAQFVEMRCATSCDIQLSPLESDHRSRRRRTDEYFLNLCPQVSAKGEYCFCKTLLSHQFVNSFITVRLENGKRPYPFDGCSMSVWSRTAWPGDQTHLRG